MAPMNSSECLILGAMTWMPFLIPVGDPSNPTVTGTMLTILDIFAERIGFCYKFIVPNDLAAGLQLPNGSWTGMMGLVTGKEKKIEFSGLGIGVTAGRARDADMTEYLYIDEWTVGFKRPELASDIAGFVKPYTAEAWIAVAAATTTVLITFYLVRIFSDMMRRHEGLSDTMMSEGTSHILRGDSHETNGEDANKRNSSPLYDAVLWTIGTLLAQAIPKSPKGEAMRVITGLWLLIALILGSVYRSNLKAMLILPKIQLPFNDLEGVVQSGLPVWTPTDAKLHEAALNSPSNTTLGQIKKQFICVDAPTNIPYGVYGMNTGKSALAGPKTGMAQVFHAGFSTTGRCLSFVIAEGFFKTSILCMLLPKGSPWKAKLDPLIVRLREAGILDHIYLQGVINSTECLKPVSSKSSTSLRPLDLGDFYGVFSVYAGGVLVILLFFMAELFIGTKEKI